MRTFRIRISDWLQLCPEGIYYRPVQLSDISIGFQMKSLEIPLCTSISGSASCLMEHLTITGVHEYRQEVVYKDQDGKVSVAKIADILSKNISFQTIDLSPWRKTVKGIAFLAER